MDTSADPDQLMPAREVCQYIHVSEQTLANWRYLRTGPRFLKAGGRVLYRRSDVDAWLEANAQGGDVA